MNLLLIKQLSDRPIAFHRSFVKLTGTINSALMLSQAMYWSNRTSDKTGWFYKTASEWEEETGMSRREQEKARATLRNTNFWMEDKKGVPATMYYKIDLERLYEALSGGLIDVTIDQVLVNQKATLISLSRVGLMRAKKIGVEAEYVDYTEVLKKYGMLCGICGDAITRGVGQFDGALTFDHKKPLAEGGEHKFDNLQPAHIGCNSSKGGSSSPLSLDKLDSLKKANKTPYSKRTTLYNAENTSETTYPEPDGSGEKDKSALLSLVITKENQRSVAAAVHVACVKHWCEEVHPDWNFKGGSEGKALKSIIGHLIKKTKEPTGEVIVSLFKKLTANLPEFYRKQTLTVIDQKLGAIIDEIKAKNAGGNTLSMKVNGSSTVFGKYATQ